MTPTAHLNEFDLIRRFFSHATASRPDVLLGVGDDAALVEVPPKTQLAISVDTLVSGVHFFPGVDPEALGHKALAVNLSDLAAMGAEPAWATLALTLPRADEAWLTAFARGFAALADRHRVQLIGGDTTRGPLSITVQVHGLVPEGSALRRSGARVGDDIYVTGQLGDAALCLRLLQSDRVLPADFAPLRERLERPRPRVEAGLALRRVASSAIDLSDGLLADLGHVLDASGVGARIDLPCLPLSPRFAEWLGDQGDWTPAVAGGDDYELCFTAAADRSGEIQRIARELGLAITRIGSVLADGGLQVWLDEGQPWSGRGAGFDHFGGRG